MEPDSVPEHATPINIIYDVYAEELSFPQIYYGVHRQFDLNVRVPPYMMSTSDIRRGVTADHVLYMAMKILRMRVVEGIYNMFGCVKQTESITRKIRQLGKPTIFLTIRARRSPRTCPRRLSS